MEWAQSYKRTFKWADAEHAKERTGSGRTPTTVVSSVVVRLKQQTLSVTGADVHGGAATVQTGKCGVINLLPRAWGEVLAGPIPRRVLQNQGGCC